MISDITWVDAENATIWDDEGNEYTDFTSGIFAANIGHANPCIKAAMRSQKFIHSYTYNTRAKKSYLEKLCRFTGYEAAVLFSSGTEATEAAWRVMRQMSGKRGIWGLNGAFHGKTYGAQIMAGREKSQYYAQEPDATCGIIIEPYHAPSAKFHTKKEMDRYIDLRKQHDLLLCVDEIQGGFGRTGRLFAYEHYKGLRPDLVCCGKGMGGGFPISALLGPKIILEPIMDLTSTHGGNPLACAVGEAVIKYMDDNNIIESAAIKGDILQSGLEDIGVKCYGKGLLAGLIFESSKEADRIVMAAEKLGLLLVHTDTNTIKIGPPLTIPVLQLEEGIKILERALNESCKNN